MQYSLESFLVFIFQSIKAGNNLAKKVYKQKYFRIRIFLLERSTNKTINKRKHFRKNIYFIIFLV